VTGQRQVVPWTQPGWFERANAWVHAELERHGIAVSGPIEQPHSYPWSTVLRVPTGIGDIFFKAVSPMHPHEPALIGALARWRPDSVPRLLSVDTERGWILMRDAGRRLRETIRPGKDMRPWLPVLPRYAEMQIGLSRRVPDLLALSVPDRRLTVLSTLYEPLLADVDVLRIDRTPGLTRAQYEHLLDLAPRVAELGGRLAENRIPETLNHGDLTDGNVFVGEGGTVFIDWGDACVSHPFYSLRTVLVSAEISLRLEENSPELYPLRDAYLEPWTRYESRTDLLEALDLSSRLASINGALTWHRLVSSLEGAAREAYAEPVPALLREFLAAESA
jgi:Phosphotransferase enzyme family